MARLPRPQDLADHLSAVVTIKDAHDQDRVLVAFQPKQLEAFNLTPLVRDPNENGPEHIGFGGQAGGGKSFFARGLAVAVALMWPGSTSIIFRKTKGEIKANHVNKIRAEIPEHYEGKRIYSYNTTDMVMEWPNQSRTYFGFLKQDDDVFVYQGPEYDVMIFEEATHYSWWAVSWLVSNRLRATVPYSRPFVVYPSNPGSQGHFWFKRLFIDRRYREFEEPDDYVFLGAAVSDNLELRRRDPGYEKRLNRLPEPWRSWLRDGDFRAGAGSALSELDWQKHFVEPFEIPGHWMQFGSFDWGFAHPFSFGHYAVNEDGVVFKVDTITGLRKKPYQQADQIKRKVPIDKLAYIVAGHDAWSEVRARGENTRSIADQFMDEGIILIKANISRVMGLNNLREFLTWDDDTGWDPMLRFMDTDGNRKCFEQLESMTTDPDDMEDVLKLDADDFGEGGDDMYDETRYATASRPSPAPSIGVKERDVEAWSSSTLAYEAEQQRISRPPRSLQEDDEALADNPFGAYL